MRRPGSKLLLVFTGGLVAGAALWSMMDAAVPPAVAQQPADSEPADDPPTDVEELRAEMAMFMADYHTSNLWFAARSQNWPLAEYYWDKVELHMDTSADADASGTRRADLEAIRRAIDRSPSMRVGQAIEKKDLTAFSDAYRTLLQGCYNCHKVAGMSYLRPRFPVPPSSAIINVDPRADWPK